MRSPTFSYGLVVMLSLLVTLATGGLGVAAQQATPRATPAASVRYEPPPIVAEGGLDAAQLRTQLIASKVASCAELGTIAGILVSTGVLPQVPPTISALTGMSVDALEARETATCQQVDGAKSDAEKSTVELLNDANMAQWLVQIHLVAMDRVMLQQSTYRPIAAEGCFAAFYRMHDLNLDAKRHAYLALVARPSLEAGQAFGAFLTDALEPHARAEDATLWTLARSVGDPNLTHSADLVAAEHQTIDQGVAAYMAALAAVERGDASPSALAPLAEQLRIRVELHFGKEEVTVVRPLQQRISSAAFEPVIAALDRDLGPWLRAHGWTTEGCR
ncbi:MAG TPA: hypothetical protein VFU81_12950 [Thermomicrobiales bacterium]|nr:hypothetical protein [Thermomicrobiales bacterium]